ncbi:MAG: spermidine/putrescine ABC transporter substrate-binding protein [Clostridia bacterium]|nr:spermidine/putrescine ABC transporter substrate-binding protein [Clostridia bacterium]
MKQIIAALLISVLLLTGIALAEEEPVLNVFTWEGYFDETTLAGFTEETGIRINYATFASNEEMFMKLQANGGSEYDIVLASDYIISAARKAGLLLPLDRSKLTGWDNLNPDYLDQYFDPENVYSIPYAVGSPMIIYDPATVEGEITRFADLWDEQFADSLWVVDDARVMLGEVLHTLGYSYNTTDKDQLAEAQARLEALKPNIRILDYDMSYNYLTSGEAKAAYIFTPFVVLTLQEDPSLVAVYPEDGIGFGIDSIVIPVKAPHPDNAHRFMDYYLRPDVAKIVAEWQCYINPNRAADELIDPDFAALSPFHIPEDLLATAEYVEDLGENESLYQDIWTAFHLN